VTNTLVGDAQNMVVEGATGGIDQLVGGTNSGSGQVVNLLYGDAGGMHDAQGGADNVTGGDNISTDAGSSVENDLYGDSFDLSGSAIGGNDTLTGGSNSESGTVINYVSGDSARFLGDVGSTDTTQGGNDIVTGGNNTGSGSVVNNLYGDNQGEVWGGGMYAQAKGGNDQLSGGNASSGTVTNNLYGDAYAMTDSTQGGNDILIAGTQSGSGFVVNNMWGDAYSMTGSAVGGNDTFVFNDSVGNQNYVMDFHQGEDIIDITAAHGLSLSDLTITTGAADTTVYLTSDPNDVITLVGFTDTLTQDDFVNLMA